MNALNYLTLDEVLIDAKHFAQHEAKSGGGLSLGQMLMHVAVMMERSVIGFDELLPWFVRAVGNSYVKRRWLIEGIPPGLPLPHEAEKILIPAKDTTIEAGVWSLESAIAKFKSSEEVCPHPFLGEMTKDEWEQFHLRHAELHFGYLKIAQIPDPQFEQLASTG